ncbi:carbohydrate ABC transporter permease [Tessaracoccus massiliensis]|uniref:carbohydrate ABC transporter permease n=1 Tax=Tessaracoccus massiliensis TaxID=1522311 RepID=UPI000693CD9E|nr:carbohydrate ABC transporter permease [Tessaracoccus massiliensis]
MPDTATTLDSNYVDPQAKASAKRVRPGKIISKILLALFGFVFFIPFLWMFINSLKPSQEVLLGGADLVGSEVRWSNYADVFTAIPFARILLNTFFIAGMGALIAVTVSVLSAYAFARLEFPGRQKLRSSWPIRSSTPSSRPAPPMWPRPTPLSCPRGAARTSPR